MNCPHCQHQVTERQTSQEVQFEFCARCGTIWLDFGARRPLLYRAVEAQAAHWDKQHRQATQKQAG